jgi:hypothetical protein
MKKAIIALSISLFSVTSFAKDDSAAIGAFLNSSDVKEAIAQAKAQNLSLDEEASAALLGGGCGFAGCEYEFLVTIGASTRGTNPQTQVIAAVVRVGFINEVRLLSKDPADALK